MPNDDHPRKIVIDELHWDPGVAAARIGVTANDGVVTLTGTVHSAHDRQLAAATAWAAPSVTEMENNIVIA